MRPFLLLALLIPSAVPAQTMNERAEKDELVFMREEEPAMRKAFQVARGSLDEFLGLAAAQSQSRTGFSLKVAISQGGNTEYFWVNDFATKDGSSFEGEIGNEPRMVKTVKLGQRYAFARAQIVDWLYIDKGQRRMVGNFTLCALLTKESKSEAEATKQRYKLDCSKVSE
ncbi:DUF2314 domain-containing protein [Roseateles sp. DAIF2]|uniref:YegJ family protein n=1 Tax=Roseateles sp. DAIF2 TaxID=2714952 RepID=UPI0018A3291B|nr:DUF2314 domain-containing protein [Roseateles sp. DAIF2]QPF73630.1 DUF2314 domain-containing protein [Roseateles sp. DAIF2]